MPEFVDIYPPTLDRVSERDRLADYSSGIYRRVLRRIDIAGLPESVTVDDVKVFFVEGPLHTQQTEIRQRPGMPIAFDKVMRHAVAVGEGELLTVAQLAVDVTEEFKIETWRARVDAALGFVVALLDERVAGVQLAEDVVLLDGDGEPDAVVDQIAYIRSFMPFDVTSDDIQALSALDEVTLDEESQLFHAAGLYLSAVREGPTAHGVLLMWLAIDAIVYRRGGNQTKDLEAALQRRGFGADWLGMTVGRLAGVRGRVAHGESDSDHQVRAGFYAAEMVARTLLTGEGSVTSAWPAAPTATAFSPAVASYVQSQAGNFEEHWHDLALPPALHASEPAGFTRVDAVRGGHANWLTIENAPDAETAERLRWAAWHALATLGLDVPDAKVVVNRNDGSHPPEAFGASAEAVLLLEADAARQTDFDTVPLTMQLAVLFGQQHVLRLGFPVHNEVTVFLMGLVEGWVSSVAFGRELDETPGIAGHRNLALYEVLGYVLGFSANRDPAAL